MDLLEDLKKIVKSAEDFKETKNYYYESHVCKKTGETKKVYLDYTLSHETTDKILRFGQCSECNMFFYHKDFKSSSR